MLKSRFPAKEWSQLSSVSHSQRKVPRPTWQLQAIRSIWKSFSSPVSVLHVQIQVPKLSLHDGATVQLPLSPATVMEIQPLLCLELLEEKGGRAICCTVTATHPLAISVSATVYSSPSSSVEPRRWIS